VKSLRDIAAVLAVSVLLGAVPAKASYETFTWVNFWGAVPSGDPIHKNYYVEVYGYFDTAATGFADLYAVDCWSGAWHVWGGPQWVTPVYKSANQMNLEFNGIPFGWPGTCTIYRVSNVAPNGSNQISISLPQT
jgi:hypothetical protein